VPFLTALLAVLGVTLAGNASFPQASQPRGEEVRALWVARTSLTSPEAIAEMVSAARDAGFNTLLIQVRGRGDAYFSDGLEPRADTLARQPESFDPLALALRLAHEKKIRVHAWVNICLVSSAATLPESRDHIVYRHPEWLMVPRALARDMALLDPHSLLYLEKLARWVRSQREDVEGLYLSPIPEGAADRTAMVIADLIARYPLDGLHLDYVRYPNDEFDYSREALLAFRAEVLGSLQEAERERRDRDAGADLLAWPKTFPERWAHYRRERLTHLVGRIRDSLRARRPAAILSAAVYSDAEVAAKSRLQDWSGWLRGGLLDVVCPMAYATDAATFTRQVTAARKAAADKTMWAGIGAYRLSSSQTAENIRIARRLGASGIVLFSYDSLASSEAAGSYLSRVSRETFGR
jgi:uncharacterized lipoprotein YddW (UPF0748 family)